MENLLSCPLDSLFIQRSVKKKKGFELFQINRSYPVQRPKKKLVNFSDIARKKI